MWTAVRQYLLLFILIVLTVNIIGLSAFFALSRPTADSSLDGYEIIACGDANGRIHKCIRIDSKAGEVNNAETGASYRVIYGS